MKNKVLLVLLLSFAVSLAASAQKITMNGSSSNLVVLLLL